MTTVTIDRKRWRCGSWGDLRHGEGAVKLMNERNEMCCLGFAARQLNPTVTPKQLRTADMPSGLGVKVPYLTVTNNMCNSSLSRKATVINDSAGLMTPEQREVALRRLFSTHGIRLVFVGEYLKSARARWASL